MHQYRKRNELIVELEAQLARLKENLLHEAQLVQSKCEHALVYQGESNGHRICPACALEERGRYRATNIRWWNGEYKRAGSMARTEELKNSPDRFVEMLSDDEFYKHRLSVGALK